MANIEELFTKEEMYDANKYLSSEEQLKNPRIALYNVMKNVQKIYEFRKEALSDEVVDYVINNGLELPRNDWDCHELLYNYKLAFYLVKLNPSLLFRVPKNNLTEELITMALDEGFDLENIHEQLLENQTFLKLAISKDPKVLNLVKKENVTDELIQIACAKKYVFELVGQREGKRLTYTSFGEDDYLEVVNNLHLLNHDELVISSFINGYESIIFEEDISENNKYYEYMINKAINDRTPITNLRNKNLYKNEIFKKYLEENLFTTENARNLMKKYLDSKYITGNLELISYILKDEFVETFGLLTVDMIMKYLVCPKTDFKIDKVLKIINEKELKQSVDKLVQNNGEHYLLQMQRIINYLAENPNVIKMILSLDYDEINNLKFIMFENAPSIKVNNQDDLKNIHNVRYDYYHKDDLSIKDKIFKYLTGHLSSDFAKIQQEEITSFRYKRLLMQSNVDIKEDENIILYLEYLENLFTLSDEELLNIWNKLENNIQPYLLDDVIYAYKKRYFEYYKSNLTKIRERKPSYILNDDVPVIEFNGENFSLIIHAFNSFEARYNGTFTTSSMFENTIGKSYISTSYINENHYKGAGARKNEAIFAFEDFSVENLLGCSCDDIYTNGEENNSLDVTKHASSYLDMFEMSCLTHSFNEFAFYRVNNNGYRSLPSAILCYDEITNKEINGARAYQLPIILIKTSAYVGLNEKLFYQYLEEVNNGDMKHVEELIGLSFKLDKKFDDDFILEIFNNISNEQKLFLINCLEIYKYDDSIIAKAKQGHHK